MSARLAASLVLGLSLAIGCSDSTGDDAATGEPRGGADQSNGGPSSPRVTGAANITHIGAGSSDSPRFRGHHGSGVARGSNPLLKWDSSTNIAWKTALPGAGSSSPALFGGRIYLTAYSGYGVSKDNPGDMNALKRHVLCIAKDSGDIIWQRDLDSALPESEYRNRMHWHGYATPTCAVDEQRVYSFFGKTGVVAHDHDGNKLWQQSVGDEHHGWGSAASPVLYENLVILNAFSESGDLVALDKTDGHEVWRARNLLKEAWNTPALVKAADGKTELVIGVMGKVLGFDPSSGKKLWECEGPNWYVCGSPVVARDAAGDIAYFIVGQKYESIAVRAGGRGDVTNSHVVWRGKHGSNVGSPVLHDGRLYFAHESGGILFCLNAATGELIYQQRLPNRPDYIYASPLIVEDKLYLLTRSGGGYVVQTGDAFKLLSFNDLSADRSTFNASPVFSDGKLFIRSDRFLYCITE